MSCNAVNVTAELTPITYIVYYDGNGNTSGSTAKSRHTYDVEKSITKNRFFKMNYYFAGWNKTSAAGTGIDHRDAQPVGKPHRNQR